MLVLRPLEKGLDFTVPVKLEGVDGSIKGVVVPSWTFSLMFPREARWECAEKIRVREIGDLILEELEAESFLGKE